MAESSERPSLFIPMLKDSASGISEMAPQELEETVNRLACTKLVELVSGTGFDLSYPMKQCRDDATMEARLWNLLDPVKI